MNVLRMIKLFAWEPKIKQQMLDKREEELKWIKKRQFLQLLNMTLKYGRARDWVVPTDNP